MNVSTVVSNQKFLLAAAALLAAALVYESHQTSEARHEVARLRREIRNFRQYETTNVGGQPTGALGDGKAEGSHADFAVVASGEGDGEVDTGEHAPPISYIDSGGTLSSDLKTKFNLSKDQFVKTQGVVSANWGAMAAWAAEAVFHDEAASAAAPDGANVFRLPAMDPQRRQTMLENFSRNLRLASNPAAADAILAGLSENLSFGYMGKYDVIFRFTQAMTQRVGLETNEPIGPPTAIPNEISVGYDCMNPKTGNVVFSTKNANLEQLSRRFGNIFQLEK